MRLVVEARPETERLVVVASVKTAVDGVRFPIGVEFIVPASMVRLFATPASSNSPAKVLVKVMVLSVAVMVVEAVSPLNAVEEVASVIPGPVWNAPTGPI